MAPSRLSNPLVSNLSPTHKVDSHRHIILFRRMTRQLESGSGISDYGILLLLFCNTCFLHYLCLIMFLSFNVKLVNFPNTILCLFLLVSIMVMHNTSPLFSSSQPKLIPFFLFFLLVYLYCQAATFLLPLSPLAVARVGASCKGSTPASRL